MVMLVEKVLRTKAHAVITPPAMQTGRQPYLLVRAPATGPSGHHLHISQWMSNVESMIIHCKDMLYDMNCIPILHSRLSGCVLTNPICKHILVPIIYIDKPIDMTNHTLIKSRNG